MNYAKIYSSYPLNDKQKKLIEAIKRYYKMDVKIVNIVDKNLIGGIKAVTDINSVNTFYIDKLNHIKKSLIRALLRILENSNKGE